MQIILASSSPYRKVQLENFGLSFSAQKPDVDEEKLKNEAPFELIGLTRFLAERKALSLRHKFPDAFIIGCDQVADLNGERLDKPGTVHLAREQLRKLAGQSHRLITTIAVSTPDSLVLHTDLTTIFMRPLTESEIVAYIELDQPLDCAGAYKIERAGLALVERVQSEDPSAVQGLPLIGLTAAFAKLGIPLTELWRKT